MIGSNRYLMVNNKDQIYIERKGKIEPTPKGFISNEQVQQIIERIVAPLGRRIDESSPMVDARLPDGSQVGCHYSSSFFDWADAYDQKIFPGGFTTDT